jgi:predicted Rossmann fold flavoprotein
MAETTYKDVLILGAGGAGLMCAAQAARRGRKVLVLDHSQKIGGKILISGGGRCNFTNLGAGPGNYVSQNPHFAKSALSRFTSRDFIDLVEKHGIAYHERKHGQLFCDVSAQAIIDLLQSECAEAGAELALGVRIEAIERLSDDSPRFRLMTSAGTIECQSLVVATGGLSIPKIGATGFGYRIAEQFGLKLVPRDPALDGFVWGNAETQTLRELAGVSLEVTIETGGIAFTEALLFTHAGLSGPVALQASLHWRKGQPITIDLLPNQPEGALYEWFLERKKEGSRALMHNLLAQHVVARLADRLCELYLPAPYRDQPLSQIPNQVIEDFCRLLHAWQIAPSATIGYGKAEVTRGGVSTDELSSKTMEARKVPGLYFVGEVVDVTGWLGGFNFQWAWASGWACGQAC